MFAGTEPGRQCRLELPSMTCEQCTCLVDTASGHVRHVPDQHLEVVEEVRDRE